MKGMNAYKEAIKESVCNGDSNLYICSYINDLMRDGDITFEECQELHDFFTDYVEAYLAGRK